MKDFMKIAALVCTVAFCGGAAAETVSITSAPKNPSLRVALADAIAPAGWKVSWEIPNETGLVGKTYSGEVPAVFKQAADDQLALRGNYHALTCESTKTLRIVVNVVDSCKQSSPPIYQLTVTVKGKKRPMVVRYFREEMEDQLKVNGPAWTSTNGLVEAKIERTQ